MFPRISPPSRSPSTWTGRRPLRQRFQENGRYLVSTSASGSGTQIGWAAFRHSNNPIGAPIFIAGQSGLGNPAPDTISLCEYNNFLVLSERSGLFSRRFWLFNAEYDLLYASGWHSMPDMGFMLCENTLVITSRNPTTNNFDTTFESLGTPGIQGPPDGYTLTREPNTPGVCFESACSCIGIPALVFVGKSLRIHTAEYKMTIEGTAERACCGKVIMAYSHAIPEQPRHFIFDFDRGLMIFDALTFERLDTR